MKKHVFAAAMAALALSACAPIANTSQTIITRSLFDESTIGGPNYPVIIRGAENVGVTPVALAQSLRFPPRLQSYSNFQAVQGGPVSVNHSELSIVPSGNNATATLTFKHGDRRIGVGTFTLAKQAFSDPNTVGSFSAVLIETMLREAHQQKFDDNDERCVWPCR